MRFLSVILAIALLPTVAEASLFGERFTIGFPVACVVGESCYLRSYVAHGEEKNPTDYTCGALTAKRHKGTDIAVEHEGVLNKQGGVPILAAADGVVTLIRTEVKPSASENPFFQLLKNHTAQGACGTGLQIEHINGWRTHYCHLKPDSLKVWDGERVQAGQVIADMGISGNSNFPHLHFELWHYGNIIDPFAGAQGRYACGTNMRYPMWDQETLDSLPYHPAGFVGGGFTAKEPTVSEARRGHHRETVLDANAPLLALWSEIYGLRAGDVLTQEIIAPDGSTLAQREERYDEAGGRALQAVSKPLEEGKLWPVGSYTGRAVLKNAGEKPVIREWRVEIR